MAVYKDNATGTWRVHLSYYTRLERGIGNRQQKRGFATKREATSLGT